MSKEVNMEFNIKCPYCFKEFNDSEVHYRMESYFEESELDQTGNRRSKSDIETDGDQVSLQIYEIRERFLVKEDQIYEEFWKKFAGTTEPKTTRTQNNKVADYNKPVLNPNDMADKQYLKTDSANYVEFKINNEGFKIGVTDCFGKSTENRVCPHCHNPLPNTYGQYSTKFISVIGSTGAGKTIYLSQLCQQFKLFTLNINIPSYSINIGANDFIKNNTIEINKKLPDSTRPGSLTQPIFFNLVISDTETVTLVIYDIAGEACTNPEEMREFGPFIEQSSAIILLIEAEHINDRAKVFDVVNAIRNRNPNLLKDMPLAVSLSKGDLLSQINLEPTKYEQSISNFHSKGVFNATDYNLIQKDVMEYIIDVENIGFIRTLHATEARFNYFAISSIGKAIEGFDEKGRKVIQEKIGKNETGEFVLKDTPVPIRIEEPLYWILHQLGYIEANNKINSSIPEIAVEQWTCIKGHTGNTGDRCSKCKRDRNGKGSFFSLFR